MQVGTTKDQGLYNKTSAAVHPGALAAGTLPQYNTIGKCLNSRPGRFKTANEPSTSPAPGWDSNTRLPTPQISPYSTCATPAVYTVRRLYVCVRISEISERSVQNP